MDIKVMRYGRQETGLGIKGVGSKGTDDE